MSNAIDVLTSLIQQAPFGFIGKVLAVGAATLKNVPVNNQTAIVRIERVLYGPDAFAHMDGQQITVQLLSVAAPGERYAFFVIGLAFGQSILVREVGRVAVEIVAPFLTLAQGPGDRAMTFAALVYDVRQDQLREYRRTADATVIGTVVALAKTGPRTRSEHDPDWWLATIDVRDVDHGDVSLGPTNVLYANSIDVRWSKAPKPQAGQRGVWVLHRTTDDLQHVAPFQMLDPRDYQASL
jgi:hypothetical protein